MCDLVAVSHREVVVASFGFDEGVTYAGGGVGYGVGGGSFDVDLLDLDGVVDGMKHTSIDQYSVVEVYIIEIDRVFDFFEDTGNDEFLSADGDGFGYGTIWGAE